MGVGFKNLNRHHRKLVSQSVRVCVLFSLIVITPVSNPNHRCSCKPDQHSMLWWCDKRLWAPFQYWYIFSYRHSYYRYNIYVLKKKLSLFDKILVRQDKVLYPGFLLVFWEKYWKKTFVTHFDLLFSVFYYSNIFLLSLWSNPHDSTTSNFPVLPVSLLFNPIIVLGYKKWNIKALHYETCKWLNCWAGDLSIHWKQSFHDANFVITGRNVSYHYDNLHCWQWWQTWHHDYSGYQSMEQNSILEVLLREFILMYQS